jgi:hypothetical protein
VNLVALWKRFTGKKADDPVTVVARRFVQIFREHGVPVTQIPRLIPELSLDKFAKPETLLPALSSEILEKTAVLFKIKRAWLEGIGGQIYDTNWCYKSPDRFFSELATFDYKAVLYPIVGLCSLAHFDLKSGRDQLLAIVMKEKICDLDDEEIHRYRVFGDGWDWGYWKSRLQLKAMARVVDKAIHGRIPLYRVSPAELAEIESGSHVPGACLQRPPLDSMSLEDFALSPAESHCSKESEELPDVLAYIEHHKLEDVARKLLT